MFTIKNAFKSFGRVIDKNSIYILTGLAVTGTISSIVLAVQATPKAMRIIEEANCETNLEKVKVAWKCYIPTGVVWLTTIGCIVGMNSINNKRNAALAGLYSIAQSTFKEYQEKIIETIGENKERKVRDEIDKDRIEKNPPSVDFIYSSSPEVLCFDSVSGRYFNSEIEKIKKIVNEINRELMLELFVPLNHLYYALGLNGIGIGDSIGFNANIELLEINFSTQLTEQQRPCLVLNYPIYRKNAENKNDNVLF